MKIALFILTLGRRHYGKYNRSACIYDVDTRESMVSKILSCEEVTTFQSKSNKTVNSTDWNYFPIGAIDLKARD